MAGRLKNVFCAIVVVASILFTVVHILTADGPEPKQLRDFGTFYTAGILVRNGKFERLYPPTTATVDDDQTDQTRANNAGSYADPGILCWYLYPPVLGYLLIPFSLLSTLGAVIAWQSVSLLCIAVSCFVTEAAANISSSISSSKKITTFLSLFFASFTLMAVDHALAVSQAPIVLGLLPLAMGYYFWQKNRPMAAGASFAFLILKPTFLAVMAPIVGAVILTIVWAKVTGKKDRIKQLFSADTRIVQVVIWFTIFCAILGLSNLLLFGPEVCLRWLHCLLLKNSLLYGKQVYYDSPWNFVSIESVVAVSTVFRQYNEIVKPVMVVLSFVVLVVQSLLTCRIMSSRADAALKREAIIFSCIAFLPLNSVYFHNYDVVLFLPIYWTMLANSESPRYKKMLPAICVTFLLLFLHFLSLCGDVKSGAYQLTQVALLLMLIVFAVLTEATYLSYCRAEKLLKIEKLQRMEEN